SIHYRTFLYIRFILAQHICILSISNNIKKRLCSRVLYLLCSCGTRYNGEDDHKKHDKKCSGQQFTPHRLKVHERRNEVSFSALM
ncbi:hypothetical protein PMAYCL1PPCAC_25272, partial [Pristionchus mayeri]